MGRDIETQTMVLEALMTLLLKVVQLSLPLGFEGKQAGLNGPSEMG